MEFSNDLLLFIIPLAILQIGLMVAALISIFKRDSYRFGNRLFWVLVVLLVSTFGPLLYFFLGRETD
ncbi:MAG: PLDc N-terminal domain-containing protein [Coriobacteriia bacterium]|nr:PLDc N-terminal domain-containing protein [Coriobacteriia bacterium]